MLAYLALQPDLGARRDKLARLLWSSVDIDQARHSFRQTLSVLRKALGPAADCLVVEGDRMALQEDAIAADVWAFEELAALSPPGDSGRVLAAYTGDLLADFRLRERRFDAWLTSERDRLREIAMDRLDRHAMHLSASDRPQEAISLALRFQSRYPMQDTPHRVLMKLYQRHGRPAAALRQRQTRTAMLEREFAIDAGSSREWTEAPAAGPGRLPAPPRGAADRRRVVLLVEDDAATSAAVRAVLIGAGFEVEIADDGSDALLAMGRASFAAAIIDVGLPLMGGLQLLEAMQRKGLGVPAVVISVSVNPEVEEEAYRLGAGAFLNKPLDGRSLLASLSLAMAAHRKQTQRTGAKLG
ncbi:MAG TPA: response regulator [Vicinamibacteria bacterium]|nr:response regulator [Vicinamibacteria bacterium]